MNSSMPTQKINWMRVFLILGLSFILVGMQILFAFYSFFSYDFTFSSSFMVKKGILESAVGIFLFVVIVKNTTMEDIKKILRSIRPHIVISALFLFGGVAAGIVLQDVLQDALGGYVEDIVQEAEAILSVPKYQQVFFIFGNNSRVVALCGVVVAFIPVIGPLVPLLVLLLNGAVIGLAPAIFDISWSHLVIGILPHGIFEIPALILASAVGLKFGVSLLKAVIGFVFTPPGISRGDQFLREIRPGWQSLKLLAVIIPLLVVAAIIEIYVSAQMVEFLGF